jgi:hypothetical protein
MARVGTLAIIAEIAGALVIPGSHWAIDYQPFDWVAAPRGRDVAMAYAQFGMYNAFNSTTAGTAELDPRQPSRRRAVSPLRRSFSAISIFSTSSCLSALSPTARSMASASATPPAWPTRSSPSEGVLPRRPRSSTNRMTRYLMECASAVVQMVARETAQWLSLCPSKSYSGDSKRDCSDRDRAEPRWGRTIDRAGFDGRRRRATPS